LFHEKVDFANAETRGSCRATSTPPRSPDPFKVAAVVVTNKIAAAITGAAAAPDDGSPNVVPIGAER
jgi:hypothetical protein